MRILSKKQSGIALIEVIVGVAVFALVSLSVYMLVNSVFKSVGSSRARLFAIQLANQQIETVRNLPYDDVATDVGWIPAGPIPTTTTVSKAGVTFTLTTTVQAINDPYDDPGDTYTLDYKRAEVSVSWDRYPGKPVLLSTLVTPRNLEGVSNGLGGLSISAFNASGDPVPSADVAITNGVVGYSLNAQTDPNGNLYILGLTPDTNDTDCAYHITVGKAGYSQDYTLCKDATYPAPTKPDVLVFSNQVSEVSFAIDLTSTINISTINQNISTNWKVNTDADPNIQSNSSIGVDGAGNSYIIWQDDRTGQAKVHGHKYNSSLNSSWAADVNIAPANNSTEPKIATTDSGSSYVGWQDDTTAPGNLDIYLDRISTSGSSLWGGSTKIHTASSSSHQRNIDLSLGESDTLYFVWEDNRSGNYHIYFNKVETSKNFPWTSSGEKKVNLDATAVDHIQPHIWADPDNSSVYIAWQDSRAGTQDIYLQKYDLDGNHSGEPNWANDIRINGITAGDQTLSDIVVDKDGNIIIVWQSDHGTDSDVYIHKYKPDGTPDWAGGEKLITSASGNQTEAVVTANPTNGHIIVAWTDDRNGNLDIYSQEFDPSGAVQWSDVRINTDSTTADQSNPSIVFKGSYIYYSWTDGRDGDENIYAARYPGAGTKTIIGNVPLQVTGSKEINNPPQIFKYSQIHTTNGSGQLTLPNMEWDSYTIEPTTGSGYTLQLSDPPQPVAVDPNTTVNIELNLQ